MTLIHILILMVTGYFIALSDSLGIQWVRGSLLTLDRNEIRRLHRFVSLGLLGMIVTGFFLFLEHPSRFLQMPTFYAKMGFVALLIINGFVISFLSRVASEKPFSSLSAHQKIPLYLSGAVSALSWIGALLLAFTLD